MGKWELTPEILDNALMFFLRDNPEHYSYTREQVSSSGYLYVISYDGDPMLQVLIWEDAEGLHWGHHDEGPVTWELEKWEQRFELRSAISSVINWQEALVYMQRAREAETQADRADDHATEPRLPSFDTPIEDWRKWYDEESARFGGKMDYRTFADAVGLSGLSPHEDWLRWHDIATKGLGFKNSLRDLAGLMGLHYDWVRTLHSPKRRGHS